MNTVQYGLDRDEKIIKLVTQGGAFTRTQIETLFFNQKDSKRKCQQRLARIWGTGRLEKIVRMPQEPAIYYAGKEPKRKTLDHTLLVNDVYVALMTQKKSYFKLSWDWEYPLMDGKRLADAKIEVYDIMSKRRHVIFLEVERYADHRCEKPRNYEALSQMNWTKESWAIKEEKRILFPAVLIVTETKLDIKSSLDILVCPVDQIKKDIYSIILRR